MIFTSFLRFRRNSTVTSTSVAEAGKISFDKALIFFEAFSSSSLPFKASESLPYVASASLPQFTLSIEGVVDDIYDETSVVVVMVVSPIFKLVLLVVLVVTI